MWKPLEIVALNRRFRPRSISLPIILGAVSVPLSIALLVGWTLLLVHQLSESTDVTLEVWLLAAGGVSFTIIVGVLVMFSVYLARQILETRRQDSFIDSVTHELKSPLASLRLCLDTMARPDLPEGKLDELHVMMREDIDRLSAFIDDVLHASRLTSENEKIATSLTDVDLRRIVDDVVEKVIARRKVDRSCFSVSVPEHFPLVTDEAALTLSLANLIDNAVKYSNPPPEVSIEATQDAAGKTKIVVQDQGIGFDPKVKKRIFERFYRVDATDVRSRKGTGLGLFVVSALLHNLGGSVEASSEGRGRGARMEIRLPHRGSPRNP